METAPAPLALFGDLEGDFWGVVIGGEQPRAAVARLTAAGVEMGPAELDLDDGDVWVLTGAGCDLRVERADAGTTTDGREHALEPCRVGGSVMIDEIRREFDVGGVRSSALAVDGSDSLRLFAAWFPGEHEITLLSARPKGARGHDRDRVEVVARGEEHPLVVDPRLSTTYDRAGAPLRVGLELWLGDDDDDELSPRRLAGLATGSSLTSSGLRAYAFECISRGEPGVGIYVLIRP